MPTPSELANFYWHCAAVTQLIEQLPRNAATGRISLYALRSATVALTGKSGVPYASLAAQKMCAANGGRWEGCGLVREHAIPVAHIYHELVAALSMKRSAAERADAKRRLAAELSEVPTKVGAFVGFPINPSVALVVDIIRASTALAWLTIDEDALLKDKLGDGSTSLNQRMPSCWDGRDPLARYRFCKIEVHPI